MYTDDLYERDITSEVMLPSSSYELDHDFEVVKEEVVNSVHCHSPISSSIESNSYHSPKYYAQTETGIRKLNVIVARSVVLDNSSDNSNTWKSKKVMIKTGNIQVQTVAWAHSQIDDSVNDPTCDILNCCDDVVPFSPIDISPSPTAVRQLRFPTQADKDPPLSSINSSLWDSGPPLTPKNSHDEEQSKDFVTLSRVQSLSSDDLKLSSSMEDQEEISRTYESNNYTSKPRRALEISRYTFPIESRTAPPSTSSNSTEVMNMFPCLHEGCDAILKTQVALRKHGKVHAPRVYQCEQCSKSFSERTKLRRHMVIHSETRPHICNVVGCNKQFAMKSNLVAHMKTHTDEKKHICPHCSHGFHHSYNLKVHVLRRHKASNTA